MLDRMQRLRRGAVTGVGVVAAVLLMASCGGSSSNNEQNTLHPSGPAAHKILNLFTPFFWLAVVIGIGVVGMTIFVAVRFRERPGEERNPVQVHGNTVLEVSWTIIPFLILAVMAVPTRPDPGFIRVRSATMAVIISGVTVVTRSQRVPGASSYRWPL